MIQTHIKDMLHKETSETVKQLLETVPDAVIENKLDDRLNDVGLNQKQLSMLTGLRHGTISDFVNGKKINISKYQLVALMISLRVTDITDIIDVVFPEDVVDKFTIERDTWKYEGDIPRDLERHYIKSIHK